MSHRYHKAIIPLTEGEIAGKLVPTVDGRTLHAFLMVGKDYSTWIKDRISQYGFENGRDYVTEARSPDLGSGNRGARIEHHLTLDMAKELAMVERTAKGKEARLYFLECERMAKAGPVSPALTDDAVLSRAVLIATSRLEDAQRHITVQAKEIEVLTPKAEALDRIADADGSHCITDAAKLLQIRPKDLFGFLDQNGWTYRRTGSDHRCGYQARIASGDLVHKVTTVLRPDGSEKTTEQVRITPRGLTKLAKLLPPPVSQVAMRPAPSLPGLAA